jgi:hypothetical protein
MTSALHTLAPLACSNCQPALAPALQPKGRGPRLILHAVPALQNEQLMVRPEHVSAAQPWTLQGEPTQGELTELAHWRQGAEAAAWTVAEVRGQTWTDAAVGFKQASQQQRQEGDPDHTAPVLADALLAAAGLDCGFRY